MTSPHVARLVGSLGDVGRDFRMNLQLEAHLVRRRENVHIDGPSLRYDIPDNDYSRLPVSHIGGSLQSVGVFPVSAADAGVLTLNWHVLAGTASVEVSFFRGGSPARPNRSVTLQRESLELALDLDGVDQIGLALRLSGRGECELGQVALARRADSAWTAPLGVALTSMLRGNDFPTASGIGLDRSDQRLGADGTMTVLGTFAKVAGDVDWRSADHLDRSTQLHLHGFAFAEPILDRSPDRLHSATMIATALIDWRGHHPIRFHSSTHMPWNDMSVASRSMAILGALRVLRFTEDRAPQVEALARMAGEHAAWLADDRNYDHRSNHGLYSDLALNALGRALAGHAEAGPWVERARRRFALTLAEVVDEREMTVREHSASYVKAIHELLERADLEGMRGSELRAVQKGLRNTLGHLTTPSGHLVPWGDTSPEEVGLSASDGVWHAHETGWTAVHEGDTALFMSAGYHSAAHKHADELAPVLYVDGDPLLIDPGYPGYDYGGTEREHAISSPAHNTVAVGGRPFDWRDRPPYGASLHRPSSVAGWTVLGGSNPLTAPERHERLVLMAPRAMAVVIDEIHGDGQDDDVAFFHFDAGVEMRMTEEAVYIVRDGAPTAFLCATTWDGENLSLEPALSSDIGVDYPNLRERRAHPVVIRRSRAHTTVTVLAWTPHRPRVRPVFRRESGGALDLVLRINQSIVRITRIGDQLFLDVS